MKNDIHMVRWMGSPILLLCSVAVLGPVIASRSLAGPDARNMQEGQSDPLPPRAVARLGIVDKRAPAKIDDLVRSSDGKLLITRSAHAEHLTVWDARSGKQVAPPFVPTSPTARREMRVSPDGKRILVDAQEGSEFWNRYPPRREGAVKLSFIFQHESIAFSPDGALMAAGDWKGNLFLIEPERLRVKRLCNNFMMAAAAFSADGSVLAVSRRASSQGPPAESAIQLWNVRTNELVCALEGHRGLVSSLAFSPDGKFLASCGEDKTTRLWDISKRKLIWQHPIRCNRVRFSPDGSLLATNDMLASVAIRDARTGNSLRVLKGCQRLVTGLAFSLEGKRLYTSDECSIQVWDVATGSELTPVVAHISVACVRFSSDGKHLATFGDDGVLRLWDPATGMPRFRLSTGSGGARRTRPARERGSDSRMAWSPDGKSIAVVAHSFFTKSITPVQTFISLMNVGSGRLEGQETLQEPHTFRPCFFSFHPDGKTIALACPDALSLWSVPSLERITSFSPPTMPGWNTAAPHRPVGAKAIAFSPNGDTLAVIDTAYRSLLLDAKTGACRHILPSPKQHRPTVAVYSPDNSLLAVCNTCVDRQYRHTLQIWETTTNRLLRIMSPHETEVNAVAFSRTGRLVATAGHDSLVRIWSVASGKQVAELQGHAWPVLSLDFSPDGRKLVSGSADGTALLWDLKGIEPSLPAADPARLATYWKTLIDRDPSSAYTAMLSLVALGDKAVAYLRARLQPVAPLDPRRFRQLLADLDSDEFTTREAASRELTRCARVAEMPLKNALARGPSEEARKRIESILATLPTTEELQQQRAVVALEQIGSTDALRLLQSLAAGADSHPLTRAARPALRRLQRGKTAP